MFEKLKSLIQTLLLLQQTDETAKLLRLKVIAGHGLARKDIFGAR